MIYANGGVFKVYFNASDALNDMIKCLVDDYTKLPDMCCECKFAHDLNVKLFSCDEDFEPIIYCDKHECICKAQRVACDWAAVSVE